jgi:hypothetical protein
LTTLIGAEWKNEHVYTDARDQDLAYIDAFIEAYSETAYLEVRVPQPKDSYQE